MGKAEKLAAAVGIAAAVGAGRMAYDAKADMERLRQDYQLNEIGDCLNENVLRGLVDAPGASLDDCRDEREKWATRVAAPTPTPTPDGKKM